MEVDVAIKTVETTDLDPQARFKAVQKLGELKVVKAIPCLVAALRPVHGDPDADWYVRKAAVASLAQIGDEAVGPLRKVVDDPDPIVRALALDALTKLRAEGVGALLAKELASDPEEQVRMACVVALRDFGGKEGIAALRTAAKSDPSPVLRERAAHVADQLEARR